MQFSQQSSCVTFWFSAVSFNWIPVLPAIWLQRPRGAARRALAFSVAIYQTNFIHLPQQSNFSIWQHVVDNVFNKVPFTDLEKKLLKSVESKYESLNLRKWNYSFGNHYHSVAISITLPPWVTCPQKSIWLDKRGQKGFSPLTSPSPTFPVSTPPCCQATPKQIEIISIPFNFTPKYANLQLTRICNKPQ